MRRMLNNNEAVNLSINNPTIPEIGLVLRSHHIVMGPSDPTITVINEYGLYKILFSSRNPNAVQFQNKVFYDILPSIRQYGAYIDPETRAQLDANPNLIHDLNARITELENQSKPNKQMYVLVGDHIKRHREEINRLKDINDELNETNKYISNERDNYIVSDRDNMKHNLELAQENRVLKNKLDMIYNVVNNFQTN